MPTKRLSIVIIGGGAAGFFAAIRCAEQNPNTDVIILERGKNVLEKVKISGGGRCNVTHDCPSPAELIKHYPRGARELLGPFHQFACQDTVQWFERRGVRLKTEADGRIFPVSDDSQTIIDCLWQSARAAGVQVRTRTRVDAFRYDAQGQHWQVQTEQENFVADRLLLASGSNARMWELLQQLGHTIVKPVPSLFTFNIRDPRIQDLPGISVPEATVQVVDTKLHATGALLVTHWGMSGPAILKLSAWGARELAERQYRLELLVNWLGQSPQEVQSVLQDARAASPRKQLITNAMFGLSARLWRNLVLAADIPEVRKWADVSKKELQALVAQLCAGRFQVNGKSTFKEEFVTAGGVDLREVQFKTFASKLLPNLYFAGEVLNIDAITGGFNFQAAWTGGWIAGEAIAKV